MFLKTKTLLPSALAGFDRSDALKNDRREEAEQDYLMGLAKLQQAEELGFEDKAAILSAYRHFATAIQKNRSEVRYQTGMAYLQLLIGNERRALMFVAEALRQDPANQRALMLQDQIQQIQTASPDRRRLAGWQALEDQPAPRSDEDYDKAYDELEDFINEEIRLMMQTSVSPEPTMDPDQARDQARFHEQLLALDQLLATKLELLEKEIETQSLERMLAPLSQLASRIEQALELHTLFHLLLDGVEGAIEDTETYLSLIDEGDSIPQANIDMLLDLCDELADQLDELSQHRGIKPVEARYEALVGAIEKLQDRIEGA